MASRFARYALRSCATNIGPNHRGISSLVLLGLLVANLAAHAQADDARRAVRLLEQRCADCHSGDNVNAGVDFSDLTDELSIWKNRFTYVKALDMLTREKMPPATEPKLAPQVRGFLMGWLEQTLDHVDIDRIPRNPGFVPPRRLTRNEYSYTVQDIFGIGGKPAEVLPADQIMGDGFENDASTLTVEPLWFERAMAAADEVVRKVWSDDEALKGLLFVQPTPPFIPENALYATTAEVAQALDMGESDFTVVARVEGMPGLIFQKSQSRKRSGPGVKQLVLRRNKLRYQIQNGHALEAEDQEVEGEAPHVIAISVNDGRASLYLDGRFLASAADMTNPDGKDHLFKVGERPEAKREDETKTTKKNVNAPRRNENQESKIFSSILRLCLPTFCSP